MLLIKKMKYNEIERLQQLAGIITEIKVNKPKSLIKGKLYSLKMDWEDIYDNMKYVGEVSDNHEFKYKFIGPYGVVYIDSLNKIIK